MMFTQEQAILKDELQLQSMVDAIHKAATENHSIDQVERDFSRNYLDWDGRCSKSLLVCKALWMLEKASILKRL